MGHRTGFQFSSTADIDWSDLAIRGPSVVPLLYRIIGNIQANRDSGLNLKVGEPFRKVLAANEQNKEGLVFDKGAVQSKTLTPETIGAATVCSIPIPTGPGISVQHGAARRPIYLPYNRINGSRTCLK